MQKTVTFLMFVGNQCGYAKEAMEFYISLFEDSSIKKIEYYKDGEPGGKEGLVKHAVFKLAGTEYMASENTFEHAFSFSPSTSIYIRCKDEKEINSLFKKLSKEGQTFMPLDNHGFSKKFAWVGDRFGVSWQLNLE